MSAARALGAGRGTARSTLFDQRHQLSLLMELFGVGATTDAVPINEDSRHRSGTSHLSQGLLQSPSIIVLIQFNYFVGRTNFIEHILGHFAIRTGGLGKDHYTVL